MSGGLQSSLGRSTSLLAFSFPDNLSQCRPFVSQTVHWAPCHSPMIPPKRATQPSSPSDFCVSQDCSMTSGPPASGPRSSWFPLPASPHACRSTRKREEQDSMTGLPNHIIPTPPRLRLRTWRGQTPGLSSPGYNVRH
jgi:hypothetical protein